MHGFSQPSLMKGIPPLGLSRQSIPPISFCINHWIVLECLYTVLEHWISHHQSPLDLERWRFFPQLDVLLRGWHDGALGLDPQQVDHRKEAVSDHQTITQLNNGNVFLSPREELCKNSGSKWRNVDYVSIGVPKLIE